MAALHYARSCLFALTAIKVAQFLLHYKTDVVVAKESLSWKCPGYAFADAGVETIQTKNKPLNELMG